MKQTFRPHLRFVLVGADQLATWSCEHDHKSIRAAALCGQLALRSMTPNTTDRTEHVRYEEILQRVLIRRVRGASYSTLQSYREQYGDITE